MKKFLITLVGGTVLSAGLAFLVLPGPGLPLIAMALAILATEYCWARRAMRRVKGLVARAQGKSGWKAWLCRHWTLSANRPNH